MGTASATLEPVDSCPACSSEERSELYESRDWTYLKPGSFQLKRCGACGSVYPDPRAAGDTLTSYYPEDDYYAYGSASPYRLFGRRELAAQLWYAVVRSVLRHRYGYPLHNAWWWLANSAGRLPGVRQRATFGQGVLLQPYRDGGALLEVGCGSGGYLDLMKALGWRRVVGVDISETAVKHARELPGVEAHVGELADLGLPESSFDAVSMSHTLEHIADPVALLEEVKRVIKPDGRIAIVVPNVDSLGRRRYGEPWVGFETPRHLVNFTAKGLSTTIENAGLRVESMKTSPVGSYGVALFSYSRKKGDPHSTYSDETHRFPLSRRARAASMSLLERAMCRLRLRRGELITVVARP